MQQKMTVTLHKLIPGDEYFLHRLMTSDQAIIDASLKSDFNKWQKLVEWSVKDPEDKYWKIKVQDLSGIEPVDAGYIGFSSPKGKLSFDSIRSQLVESDSNTYLVLEIYLLKEFRGRDVGNIAYHQAIERIREMMPKKTINVYASTYMTNLKAQRFFTDVLGMVLSHYYSWISVVFKVEYSSLTQE